MRNTTTSARLVARVEPVVRKTDDVWCGTCGRLLGSVLDLDINGDCYKCAEWWKANPPPTEPTPKWREDDGQLELPLA